MIDRQQLEARVQYLAAHSASNNVNCASAALFLLGVYDQEKYLDTDSAEVQDFLHRSTPVTDLSEADMVVVRGMKIFSGRGMGALFSSRSSQRERAIQHLAVVRDRQEKILCDRDGYNKPFRPSVSWRNLERESREHYRVSAVEWYKVP